MGELLERVKLNNLVYGNGIVENYKNNSLYFYNKFSKSDDEVTSMNVGQMQLGGFYHLHYMDDSNLDITNGRVLEFIENPGTLSDLPFKS